MKKTFMVAALAFATVGTQAQVSDLSVTAAPTISYNWFDSKSTIDNGWMYGAQVGFGFGRFLELRGIYEQSLDLQQNFGQYEGDIREVFPDFEFEGRDIDIRRVGGEFKANIPSGGALAPYITLGTGVQRLRLNSRFLEEQEVVERQHEENQIYVSGGVGFKFNMGDRLVLNLEGKNTVFNLNPGSVMYDASGTSEFQDWIGDQSETRMYNWAVLAGLQFYLGGRSPEEMTAIDRAYLRQFSSGLRGLKLIIEPGGAYVDFHDDSPMRNTYLLGGTAGFDLGDYVGLRGFYYQSTRDESISLDWDRMAMYGGEFIGRLNVARGITPYVTVGGGYMNVYSDYEGRTEMIDTVAVPRRGNSGYFAKGGVGVSVPITRNLEVFGAANLMYTTERSDVENLQSPSELMQHTMYQAGLRVLLAARPDTDRYVDRAVSREADRIADRRLEESRSEYQQRIKELEDELADAYASSDADKAVRVIEEKRRLEDGRRADRDRSTDGKSRVVLTPQELESLVEKVIKDVDEKEDKKSSDTERIDRLERLLLEINTGARNYDRGYVPTESNDRILDELRRLNQRVDEQNRQIANIRTQPAGSGDKTTVITTPQQQQPAVMQPNPQTRQEVTTTPSGDTVVTTKQEDGYVSGFIVNRGMSAFTGVNFGEATTFNVGLKAHYQISNSSLEFVPDAYFAMGDPNGFGINANVHLPFEVNRSPILAPYVGVGVGLNSINDDFRFATNLILGTSLDLLGGRVYADYTSRGLFDNNQVAIGYKFFF
ncbi:MAG: outer membrane beta-barrel protein [Weeksellaceae bacterium]|nr:outer membrane beta-barrel protein [Weeksellaceae bacterium]